MTGLFCTLLLATGFPYPANWSQTSTPETLACGASPCAVSSTAMTVFNASGRRFQCLVQNTGSNPVYCVQGTSTPSASGPYDFILPAQSSPGNGGSYSCNQGVSLWHGAIRCVTPAATTSTVGASAAGL